MKRENKRAIEAFAQTPVGKPIATVVMTVMYVGWTGRMILSPRFAHRYMTGTPKPRNRW